MKRYETLCLLAMAVVLCVGVTGCGNGQSGTSKTPSSGSGTSSGQEPSATPAKATSTESFPVQDLPNQ